MTQAIQPRTMAVIENIYLSINFSVKKEFFYSGISVKKVLDFNACKQFFLPAMYADNIKTCKEEIFLRDSSIQCIHGIKMYPYGYAVKDKFRIFFANSIGDNYPVYVIVDAVFLHLNNVFDVLKDVQDTFFKILRYYMEFETVESLDLKLSRIDIANHNNFINLDSYIGPDEYNSRVVTRLRCVRPFVILNGEKSQEVSYFRYGSGNIIVRFYNKVREICEQRYKSFFFKRWLQYGLIDQHTFDVYDMIYRFDGDYRVNFIYANICKSIVGLIPVDVQKIYFSQKYTNSEKYDLLMDQVKKYNVKLVTEIVNVEYECHAPFLKLLHLKNKKDENINMSSIYDILMYSDILYRYLTDDVFRVVSRKSKAKRKRDKKVDKQWQLIQNSKILNIYNVNIDNIQLNKIKEYQTSMDKYNTLGQLLKRACHLKYVDSQKFNKDLVKNITFEDLLKSVEKNYYSVCAMNENYFNLQDKLYKQLKYYGEK